MDGILAVTGPIFLLVALGFALVRTGVFEPAATGVLGDYVVKLALPALIFRTVTGLDLAAAFDPGYLLGYLAGSLAAFAAGYLIARRGLGLGPGPSTFHGMGSGCANSGFIGYPVLMMAMPATAGAAVALTMIVENLVMIPLVLILAERAGGPAASRRAMAGRLARRLATNPILLALAAALVVAGTGLSPPGVIARAIDLVAASSAAVSLIVIGGALVGVPVAGAGRESVPVVACKLLLHPLAVAAAFGLLAAAGIGPATPELATAGILLAAMPAMSIYPILARNYGAGDSAAVAMLTMTVAAFFTVSGLIWLLGPDQG